MGQGVFDECVMQRTEGHGPGEPCGPDERHVDRVTEDGSGSAVPQDLEPMGAHMPPWRLEPKYALPARFLGDDRVADGPMAAAGTYAEWLVQAHPRPVPGWPQRVVWGGQPIQQPCGLFRAGAKVAFVDVDYAHGVVL